MNKYALELIKKWEGCRLEAYKDSVGKWTIGYGYTYGVEKGMKISSQMAEDLFKTTITRFEEEVEEETKGLELTDWQKGALISFNYNLGIENLKKSELLAKIKEDKENYDDIARCFLNWDNAGGEELKGLSKRRLDEANIYANGDTWIL